MTLSSGVRLGPYEILGAIGAGGMGEVYRARDTRLGRDAAIKVLPASFPTIAQSTTRFVREAQVLASLNHPGIASIFGFEECNGVHAIIMELVEGPTLADRLRQGAIPVEETLAIVKQVAEALEYAHERGIIHRDLKPSNVKVTPNGAVKLLDFGLAKVIEGDSEGSDISSSPTISAVATQGGIILGTAAYMSPEQARGKSVDRRADIWSFGVVLFEMLTGRRLYDGETTSDILARVIEREPDLTRLPPNTPARIRELIRRCLTKNPRQRLCDIGEARIAVEEVLSGSPTAESAPGAVPTQLAWHTRMTWALLAVGIVLGVVSAGLIAWYLGAAPERRLVSRFAFAFSLSEGQSAASAGFPLRDFPAVAISSDGTELAYVSSHGETTQVLLRPVDRLESRPLPGTTNATSPFFSPDGQWVGFFADGKLKKVSIHGGESVTLCDAPINRSASWGKDNTIIFAPTLFGGLMRISAAGGSPEVLTTPDVSKGERSHRWPEILPGGKAVVFVTAEAKDIGFFSEAKIAVERLDTHEMKILPIQGTYPRYSPSGHLLFAREGSVFAVRFDPNRLEVAGPPIPVLDGVKSSPNSGAANFMVSDIGSLVYLPENATALQGLLNWVDRKNQVQALAAPARGYGSPQISPDGQRVAVSIFTGTNADIWLYEIPHGTLTRLTFDKKSSAPVWSPDGKRIAFERNRGPASAIVSIRADGSGGEETLVSDEGSLIQIPTSWSPNGKFLAYWTVGMETGRDIAILPLTGDRKPQPFLRTKFDELQARFSPDGQWMAYTSDESGPFEVYVQPFPGPGGKWQISTEGGNQPTWGRNGRELFYLNSNKIMGVSITTQPSFRTSIPRFIADISPSMSARLGDSGYDVSPDGQRFLFVKANVESGPPDEVRVVLNWTEELKHLAPGSKQP